MTEEQHIATIIQMNYESNLVALDRTLASIRQAPRSYFFAAARCEAIGRGILRAVDTVKSVVDSCRLEDAA